MRKVILFIVALIISMAAWGQTRSTRSNAAPGTREPVQTKESIFFADGTLDEYTAFQWDAIYSHIDNQIRYSASGAMLEQIEFAYNEDKGYVTTRITRDVESRLRNRVVYQYNAQGRLFRESLVDNKGRIVSTYEYGYDDRGNNISRIIKNRAGDTLATTSYTVDAAGKMTASETRDMGGNVISSTTYAYDTQGNLTGQRVLNREGRVTSNIRAVWQDGREVRNEMADASGTVLLLVTNEYGADGELTKRTVENFQGESKQVMQYEYIFRPRR